jgi:hypothetical protein
LKIRFTQTLPIAETFLRTYSFSVFVSVTVSVVVGVVTTVCRVRRQPLRVNNQ